MQLKSPRLDSMKTDHQKLLKAVKCDLLKHIQRSSKTAQSQPGFSVFLLPKHTSTQRALRKPLSLQLGLSDCELRRMRSAQAGRESTQSERTELPEGAGWGAVGVGGSESKSSK